MPGTPPPVSDERDAMRAFLRQQHDAARYLAFGLTDDQAHTTPSASAISIASLIKHLTYVERGWRERAEAAPRLCDGDQRPTDERAEAYGSDWDASGDRLEDLLADFSAGAAETEKAVGSLDLDLPVPVPPGSPWFPRDLEAWSVRWVFHHILEEITRHVGQGDIVRESIDGATMYELMAGAEGWPETQWLKPWRPAEHGEPA